MCSASRLALLAAALALPLCVSAQQELRVCSDPNNLPYSNQQQQGFENEIATLIAHDLNRPVSYFWLRQGEKFFQNTLNKDVCDVVMGVPVGFDQVATTAPYYRSSYVFITRRDRNLHITGFDDPRLRTLKIGVHVLGEQDDSVPPVHAFTARGIVKNLVGYSIFGNLSEADPRADLIKAVADRSVDVAVAWGPIAGYFAEHSPVPLDITPVTADSRNPSLPFHFDIAIGVRPADAALRNQLDAELIRRRTEITAILTKYGVPQLPLEAAPTPSAGIARTNLQPARKGE